MLLLFLLPWRDTFCRVLRKCTLKRPGNIEHLTNVVRVWESRATADHPTATWSRRYDASAKTTRYEGGFERLPLRLVLRNLLPCNGWEVFCTYSLYVAAKRRLVAPRMSRA